MIFTGDIALPFTKGITLENFPMDEMSKIWIGNLEGSLVENDVTTRNERLQKRIVFNDLDAIRDILNIIPYHAFGMANNHLLDACSVEESEKNLGKLGKQQFGAGQTISKASTPLLIEDSKALYALYAFGSKDINCVDATPETEGSNPYNKWNVLDLMKKALTCYPDRRVIAFMHWNVELEHYPQPLDRELSHKLIEMGVYAVIGCHAHRVQPYEIYKGHPIVYGLGNFAFRQNSYMNGELKFPDFSYPEILFEIDGDEFYIHHCRYNPLTHVIHYEGKENVKKSNAQFAELDASDYKIWFKKNRFQRKGITISYYEDSRLKSAIKYRYNRIRGGLINILVKNKSVFNFVKSLAAKIFK